MVAPWAGTSLSALPENCMGERDRAIAQQLLLYEAGSGAVFSDTYSHAAFRVSEKLRRPLCSLAGSTAFRALLSRSLVLAKAQTHALAMVQVSPDGSLEGLNALPEDHAIEACLILIAQLISLLNTLIGETLLLRILSDIWPDLQDSDSKRFEEGGYDLTR